MRHEKLDLVSNNIAASISQKYPHRKPIGDSDTAQSLLTYRHREHLTTGTRHPPAA